VAVPIITRKQIQEAEKNLLSDAIPASHGKAHKVTTSGSTGMNVTVSATELSDFFWRAFTLRDHLWHGRDFQGKMAIIRRFAPSQALPPNGEIHAGWGPSVNAVYTSGPLVMLNITASVEQQLAWLQQQSPNLHFA
jgi:phenylacetate-CoA ligase